MKKYTIEKKINNTTIFYKVYYDCLSQKQKNHLGINKIRLEKARYMNTNELTENTNETNTL